MSTEPSPSFIFHDPTGRRWVRFQRATQSFAVIAGIGLALFGISMVVLPSLPSLGLPSVSPINDAREVAAIIKGQKAARNIPFQMQRDMKRDAKKINYVRSASPVIHPKTAARASNGKPVVFGYYVNWDPASQASLRASITHLTHLIPEWFYLKNAQGDLEDQTDPTIVAIAKQSNLPILAEVNNNRDGWQPEELHQVLTHANRRADLIDNILSNLQEHKFAGVNIDFESLEAKDREPLVLFMKELHAKLAPAGLIISQSVPPDDPAYDLKRLVQYEDYIMVMVYDEHEQTSVPGPVASQSWYDDQLDRLAKLLPPEKTVIGVGDYGYDWVIGDEGSTEVKFSDVMAAAIASKATIQWDPDTANPYLRFKDKTKTSGAEHEIWFLDAVTALNQLQDVADQGFRGIGIWRLGAEDPDFWKVVNPAAWPADKFDVTQLGTLTAQQVVNHYGEGDIIQISEMPRDGRRVVTAPKEPDGDYTEKYEAYPTYWVVDRMGATTGKVVCLSFDDGPDPRYTPKILDILKAKHVPASFFLVGVNAEANPGLVKREYAEGMELGNHTYSHPNIATTSELRTKYELTFTQRIIENAIGHSTILFRPPYNADSEPTTAAEIVPIERAQSYGFLTIGESIDPRDWEPGTTAARILEEVKDEEGNGQIILLHDAGGDRNATIAALPGIIDFYRAQGYRFGRVGDLLGKSRSQVMPIPTAEEMRWAQIEGGAFDLKSNFKELLGLLFVGAIFLTLLRSLVFGILAVLQKRRAAHMYFGDVIPQPVSVIIAAYNEDKVIVRTVQSILDNGYPADLEVIVIDDGSKDATLSVLRENFALDAARHHPHPAERRQIRGPKQRDRALEAPTARRRRRRHAVPQRHHRHAHAPLRRPQRGCRQRQRACRQSRQTAHAIPIHRVHLRLQSRSPRPGSAQRHYRRPRRRGSLAQRPDSVARRLRPRHPSRRRRPHHGHPPPWLQNPLRAGRHCLHRSTRRPARPRQAALPLGFRHPAGRLETSRRALHSQVRHARLRRAPQHLALSGAALRALALRRNLHDPRALRR